MLKYIWKIRKSYILISFILGIFGSLSPVIMNFMIKEALDVLTVSGNFSNFLKLLIIYSLYSLSLSLISNYYNNVYSTILIEDINEKILEDIYYKSRNLELLQYDNCEFFNTYKFVLSNTLEMAYSSVKIFVNLVSAIFGIGFLLTLILTIDPLMVVFAFFSSLINFLINIKQSKISYQIEKEIIQPYRKISYVGRIYYLKDYAKDLRTSNLNIALSRLYKEGKNQILQVVKEKGIISTHYSNLQNIIQICTTSIVMVYLSKSLVKNTISPGAFAAVFNSFGQLSTNIEQILGTFPKLYKNSLYIEDFKNFLNYKIEEDGEINLEEYIDIEIKNLCFSYQEGREVLKNINLKVKKGEKIALVGKNGSGKTTLANIIQGHYKPTDGDIYINNISYNKYTKKSINNKIGSLPQDFKIYSLAILENIFMNTKEKITQKEIEKAQTILEGLSLRERIEKLPKGLYTNITSEIEEGANFSGGELQKIALARVLLKEHDLIILDEPSSALDAYSEKEVFDKILEKYSKKSVILISHKLANVINVDRIYFIDNGMIVEEGTHEDLMKQGGAYKELFDIQFSNYLKKQKTSKNKNYKGGKTNEIVNV